MTNSKPCETCGGRGWLYATPAFTDDSFDEPITDECPDCNGTGVQPESTPLSPSSEVKFQPTPPSTEDELEAALEHIWSAAIDWATNDDFSELPDDERDTTYFTYRANVISPALKLTSREQHRHTAEVLKGLREKRTTVDNLDVIFWHEVVQLIAAEEQAMKGEKA